MVLVGLFDAVEGEDGVAADEPNGGEDVERSEDFKWPEGKRGVSKTQIDYEMRWDERDKRLTCACP